MFKPLRFRCDEEYGAGTRQPLDREAKIRIMNRARALMKPTEAGKAYGLLTAKTLEVLKTLLWHFHNAQSGACFPSYETLAAEARCARSTVAKAIKTLKTAGILAWVNRLVRKRVPERDLSRKLSYQYRVFRTSNAYVFRDQKAAAGHAVSSKSETRSGTTNQDFIAYDEASIKAELGLESPLRDALLSLGKLIRARQEPQPV